MRMFDLNTEKMIWILLLLFLTSCVCGTFIVNVKQISYQAEENGNVTMEWIFPPKPDMSLSSLTIYCAKVSLNEEKPLYYLQNGVEDPESQHEQFAGRVRCDEHRLREGTIRFHLSRLRTNDSGVYLCEVSTGYGGSFRECSLTVTGKMGTAPDLPEDPEQREHGWFGLFGVVTAALVVLVALVAFTRQRCCPSKQQGQVQEENVDIGLRTDQTKTKSSSPQPKLLHVRTDIAEMIQHNVTLLVIGGEREEKHPSTKSWS